MYFKMVGHLKRKRASLIRMNVQLRVLSQLPNKKKFLQEESCLDWGTQELGEGEFHRPKESGTSPNRVHIFLSKEGDFFAPQNPSKVHGLDC